MQTNIFMRDELLYISDKNRMSRKILVHAEYGFNNFDAILSEQIIQENMFKNDPVHIIQENMGRKDCAECVERNV